jgi:hypothetical protein
MENFNEAHVGLNHHNRALIILVVEALLLLWGPLEPYGIAVRMAYLIVSPILLWFGLGYFGKKWKADHLANDRLKRAIFAMLAGGLFVGTYLAYTSKYHSECTQTVRTRDGYECVGDYVSVSGSDKVGALVQACFGIMFAWHAVVESKDNKNIEAG